MSDGFYEQHFTGSFELMDTVRVFARDYSLWILGALVVAILYIVYIMFMRKEGMYNPGGTAWFQLGNWKENMVNPATLNCAAVDMAGYDSQDPYRYYIDSTSALGGTENFSDAYLARSMH